MRPVEAPSLRGSWPWVLAVIGLAVLALAFVPEWLTHHREMRGEGYRTLTIGLNAWQLRSVPVISAGVVTAVVVGFAALVLPRRWHGWLPAAAAIPLGLFLAAAFPIAHFGQVSTVWVSPGWVLPVAIVAVAAMTVVASRRAPLTRRVVAVGVGVFVLTVGAGVGMRVIGLEQALADRPHWTDGSYVRDEDGARRELTLEEGRYAAGTWSGRFEASGLTMILVDDPACPDARGAYRIFDAGGDDIRWELIVDVCADGARTEDLVGTWQRQP